jgi:hypothetical protein
MLTVAATIAAVGFLAGAVGAALGLRVIARVLAALSALVLVLPGIELRPSLALALGAAALATPLPCVLAAAGSLLVLVLPEAGGGPSSVVLGLAASAAAGAVSATLERRVAEGKGAGPLAALAGAGLVLLLVRLEGGAVLRWGFTLGHGPATALLPGAGLLLGLTLLVCLGGTLLVVAQQLAPAVEGARALGTQVLFPGAALGLLAVAHVTLQGFRHGRELLAGQADALVALVLLGGALATALAGSLRAAPPTASPTAAAEGWAADATALATSLAWLAAGLAGWECWRTEGTYLCRPAAVAVSAGLVGLAAVAPTGWSAPRRALLLVVLVLAALFPSAFQ